MDSMHSQERKPKSRPNHIRRALTAKRCARTKLGIVSNIDTGTDLDDHSSSDTKTASPKLKIVITAPGQLSPSKNNLFSSSEIMRSSLSADHSSQRRFSSSKRTSLRSSIIVGVCIVFVIFCAINPIQIAVIGNDQMDIMIHAHSSNPPARPIKRGRSSEADQARPIQPLSDIDELRLVSPGDFELQPDHIGSVIPKLLWQCGKGDFDQLGSNTMEHIRDNIEAHRERGYIYEYYDDESIVVFMTRYYKPGDRDSALDTHPTSTVQFKDRLFCAFSMLKSGTAIADLWRLVVLRRFGGIYMDIDTVFKDSTMTFDDIITEQDEYLLVYADENHSGSNQNYLAAKAHHPFIHNALEVAVENILSAHFYSKFEYFGWNIQKLLSDNVDSEWLNGCALKAHFNEEHHGGKSLPFAIGELTGPTVLQIGIENAILQAEDCALIDNVHFVVRLPEGVQLINKFEGCFGAGCSGAGQKDHWIEAKNRKPEVIFHQEQLCYTRLGYAQRES